MRIHTALCFWIALFSGTKMKGEFMGDYKFDTFYYSEDQSSEHYLSEIENLSDEEYGSLYKGKMYCPWCRKPQLTKVNNAGGSFLRTYPNQPHVLVEGEMCPYECETAPVKVVEEYINELREQKKIKSMLEATLRRLYKQQTDTKSVISKGIGNKDKNPLIIESLQGDKTIKKNIIPHYSFKSWGKNIPQDQLLIVYGKVYIELKETQTVNKVGNKITQTYIHFKDIQSKKLITSCRKPNGLEVLEGYYYAVVLGICYSKETDKGRIYYNLRINFPDSQSIILKSIST